MRRLRNHSALLSKYTLMYEKKPRSRVFAPLAETYRKLGMIDEALKILKEGIKNHPTYTLGYIVLGNCYFDRQNFEMAYASVRPFVAQNLENITLQKLFAKTCLNLGHLEEALTTFKNLLLINPKDKYFAEQVKLLEDDLLLNDQEEIKVETYNNQSSVDETEWVQVDFTNSDDDQNLVSSEELDDWSISTKSPIEEFKKEIEEDKIQVKEHRLDDEYFYEEYDNPHEPVDEYDLEEENANEDKKPIITHTLVDLYCGQGHFDKALDVLESILKLHPNDKMSKDRLLEVKKLMQKNDAIHEESNLETLKETFDKFLFKLRETSMKRLSQL